MSIINFHSTAVNDLIKVAILTESREKIEKAAKAASKAFKFVSRNRTIIGGGTYYSNYQANKKLNGG